MTRKRARQQEQAIMLALLSVPEFRAKAGLPPLSADGDDAETLAMLLDCTPGRVRQIIQSSIDKLRMALLSRPDTLREFQTFLNQHDNN